MKKSITDNHLKHVFLLLILNICFNSLSGQTVFFTEDFETEGNGIRYATNNEFFDSDDDYYGRVNATTKFVYLAGAVCGNDFIDVIGSGSSGSQTGAYVGQSGNYFFAGEDVDDPTVPSQCGASGGLDNRDLVISNINISGASTITCRILVAAENTNSCGGNAYDDEERLIVHYTIDAGPETTNALCFRYSMCNGGTDTANEPFHQDTNCDGVGEGAILFNTFQEFSFTIPAGGTTLALRIDMLQDDGNAGIAYDNIRLEAVTVPVVPVTLASFEADNNDNQVLLNWVTETELNNDYFEVQHSFDGINFETIGMKEGAGTSAKTLSYSYTHLNPEVGTNYYRLKQNDFDGAFDFSEIRTVRIDQPAFNLATMPNPFKDAFLLQMSKVAEIDTPIEIYNMMGMLVYDGYMEKGQDVKSLNLTGFKAGLFIVKVGERANAVTKRVIKLQ